MVAYKSVQNCVCVCVQFVSGVWYYKLCVCASNLCVVCGTISCVCVRETESMHKKSKREKVHTCFTFDY